jgi:hypothetical protein
METLAKVEGHTGIYRDEVTGAIVNTDMKINTLKNEVSEMKSMLQTILGKLNG